MKYWLLILLPTVLLTTAPVVHAHNLISVTGNSQDHQHVYRHQEYGKPLQQGHLVQSSKRNGTILWGSDMRPEYGKSNVRTPFKPHFLLVMVGKHGMPKES